MEDMILWTPENAYVFQHRDYDPTMPHVEFVWPTLVGRTKMLASVYPTWSSFMHVGSVPRGVRKITTCKVEPKPNGDVAIGKITKSDIPSTPPTPKISPLDAVSELFSRL